MMQCIALPGYTITSCSILCWGVLIGVAGVVDMIGAAPREAECCSGGGV